MLNITEEYVNQAAPNQNAITNGLGLIKKNKFVKLGISEDDTAIFGECKGSGASNYSTSVDFINIENPAYRCTCPSRQFPCKHSLGLMYAYTSGKKFEVLDIPNELLEKRGKVLEKEEKKKAKADVDAPPKKVNQTALLKKVKAQKEGLELLEKITYNIVKSGLGTINNKALDLLDEQAKQLGNYYIPGAQNALKEFIYLFKEHEEKEKIYTEAQEYITRLYSLSAKGLEYLEKRSQDPLMPLDTTSTLDEWLGHAWQLAELKEAGLMQNEVELVQLSFNAYSNNARMEYVDSGIWINLSDGKIVETKNYRPFKAAKYIKEEDSFFSVASVPELFVYPGDLNPRVRWEGMTIRELLAQDYEKISGYAQGTYQEVLKTVKNQIKNPLSSKTPLALLKCRRIGRVDTQYVMESVDGQRLLLDNIPNSNEPDTLSLFELLPKEELLEKAVLVRFYNNIEDKKLIAKPLSIILENKIIRLAY